MKPLSQYLVSFPYGATSPPYSPSSPHQGDDRAAPLGTPVDVNDSIIGLVGSTGKSTGPHTHIGRYVNGTATNPNKGGLQLVEPRVHSVGEDASNGKYVRLIDAYGVIWVYLHLSKILVKPGDIIKPEPSKELTMTPEVQAALNDIKKWVMLVQKQQKDQFEILQAQINDLKDWEVDTNKAVKDEK